MAIAPFTWQGSFEKAQLWLPFAESVLVGMKRGANGAMMQQVHQPEPSTTIMVQCNPDSMFIKAGTPAYITSQATPHSSRSIYKNGIFKDPTVKPTFFAGDSALRSPRQKQGYWYSDEGCVSWSANGVFLGGRWADVGNPICVCFHPPGMLFVVLSNTIYAISVSPNSTNPTLLDATWHDSSSLGLPGSVYNGGFLTDGKTLFILCRPVVDGVVTTIVTKFTLRLNTDDPVWPYPEIVSSEEIMTGQPSSYEARMYVNDYGDLLPDISIGGEVVNFVAREDIRDLRVVRDTAYIYTATLQSQTGLSKMTLEKTTPYYRNFPYYEFGNVHSVSEQTEHTHVDCYVYIVKKKSTAPERVASSTIVRDGTSRTINDTSGVDAASDWYGVGGLPTNPYYALTTHQTIAPIVHDVTKDFSYRLPRFSMFDGDLVVYETREHTQVGYSFSLTSSVMTSSLIVSYKGIDYTICSLTNTGTNGMVGQYACFVFDSISFGAPLAAGTYTNTGDVLMGDAVVDTRTVGSSTEYRYVYVDGSHSVSTPNRTGSRKLTPHTDGTSLPSEYGIVDIGLVEHVAELLICVSISQGPGYVEKTARIKRIGDENSFTLDIQIEDGRIDQAYSDATPGTSFLSVTQL